MSWRVCRYGVRATGSMELGTYSTDSKDYYRTIALQAGKRKRMKPVKPVGSNSIRSDDASSGPRVGLLVSRRKFYK